MAVVIAQSQGDDSAEGKVPCGECSFCNKAMADARFAVSYENKKFLRRTKKPIIIPKDPIIFRKKLEDWRSDFAKSNSLKFPHLVLPGPYIDSLIENFSRWQNYVKLQYQESFRTAFAPEITEENKKNNT